MKTKLAFTIILIAIGICLVSVTQKKTTQNAVTHPPAQLYPNITIHTPSEKTIRFKTQNGETRGDKPTQERVIPHMVLFRNGTLTEAKERTIVIEIQNLQVPPPGAELRLFVSTTHGSPDAGTQEGLPLVVWKESQWVSNPKGNILENASAVFTKTFTETIHNYEGAFPTPTDYFTVKLTTFYPEHQVVLQTFTIDYAFLMENQWMVELPKVIETAPGAAPDTLLVNFCDMIPFRRNSKEVSSWLPRKRVSIFIETEIVPAMAAAFGRQSNDWVIPWYPEWRPFFQDVAPNQLDVTFSDGKIWYHGPAPSRGNAGISIKVNGGINAAYDTLLDGILSNFHHELFHNLQRGIQLHFGGKGKVGGRDGWLEAFSEGTAVMVSSVGQPEIELGAQSINRSYMQFANGFLGYGGLTNDLGKGLGDISGYRTAIYWRFLYEQCGGLGQEGENPVIGMEIIRNTLVTLYSWDDIQIQSGKNLDDILPDIMNQVFGITPACPFRNYEDSYTAFVQAVIALGKDGGRCTALDNPTGCGLYDPFGLYTPPLYNGESVAGSG